MTISHFPPRRSSKTTRLDPQWFLLNREQRLTARWLVAWQKPFTITSHHKPVAWWFELMDLQWCDQWLRIGSPLWTTIDMDNTTTLVTMEDYIHQIHTMNIHREPLLTMTDHYWFDGNGPATAGSPINPPRIPRQIGQRCIGLHSGAKCCAQLLWPFFKPVPWLGSQNAGTACGVFFFRFWAWPCTYIRSKWFFLVTNGASQWHNTNTNCY